jgi:hypothetical protein
MSAGVPFPPLQLVDVDELEPLRSVVIERQVARN